MEKISFLNTQHSDINKCVNIDLNLEANVSELEDPVLIKHVKDSRKKLEDYKKKYQEDIIKTKEEIDEIQAQYSKQASLCVNKFNLINCAMIDTVENIVLQYSNIKKINNDSIPYGYPQIEYHHKDANLITKNSFKKNLEHLIQKLKTPIDSIIDLNSGCLELEKSINIITRNYNLIISQLFDFNQILLKKNEELIEKIYKYETVDDNLGDNLDDNLDEIVSYPIDEIVSYPIDENIDS
jgi:hypothetical protein